MTPKEKAKELVDKMYNTEHCGIKHFPNKNYCDCVDINEYQAKQCALMCVDEQIALIYDYSERQMLTNWSNALKYWEEVKEEIYNLKN